MDWAIIERTRSSACGAAIFLPTLCVSATLYAWRKCIADTNAQTRQPTLTHRADDLFLWQRARYYTYLHLTAANLRSLYRSLWQPYTGRIVAGAYLFHSLYEENCQLLQHIADRIAIAVGMPMPGAA